MLALIVIDMLNDFVTGVIANPRSERIIPPLAPALGEARLATRLWSGSGGLLSRSRARISPLSFLA